MLSQFKSKKLRTAAVVAVFASVPLSWADSFVANQSTFHPGETLQLSYVADQPINKALYLGAMVNNALVLFNEQGAMVPYVSGAVTPPRLLNPAAGTHNLLTITAPEGFYADVTAYQVLGTPGTDLLAGNYDASTLREIRLKFSMNGGALYAQHCASCHEADPTTNKYHILRGVDAAVNTNAIRTNMGGMGYLSTLSADEINAITTWIQNPTLDCHS
jgi:hypothetical protein